MSKKQLYEVGQLLDLGDGMFGVVTEYKSFKDITIDVKDYGIVSTSSDKIKRGTVLKGLGRISCNKNGESMKLLKRNKTIYTVEFENGNVIDMTISQFRDGTIDMNGNSISSGRGKRPVLPDTENNRKNGFTCGNSVVLDRGNGTVDILNSSTGLVFIGVNREDFSTGKFKPVIDGNAVISNSIYSTLSKELKLWLMSGHELELGGNERSLISEESFLNFKSKKNKNGVDMIVVGYDKDTGKVDVYFPDTNTVKMGVSKNFFDSGAITDSTKSRNTTMSYDSYLARNSSDKQEVDDSKTANTTKTTKVVFKDGYITDKYDGMVRTLPYKKAVRIVKFRSLVDMDIQFNTGELITCDFYTFRYDNNLEPLRGGRLRDNYETDHIGLQNISGDSELDNPKLILNPKERIALRANKVSCVSDLANVSEEVIRNIDLELSSINKILCLRKSLMLLNVGGSL